MQSPHKAVTTNAVSTKGAFTNYACIFWHFLTTYIKDFSKEGVFFSRLLLWFQSHRKNPEKNSHSIEKSLTYIPCLYFLCRKLHVFLTIYPPLYANVICESFQTLILAQVQILGGFLLQLSHYTVFLLNLSLKRSRYHPY